MSDFVKGDRVRHSAKGIEVLLKDTPHRANLIGTIMGYCRDPKCIRVCFDGQKTPTAYHKSFLEKVQ